MPRNKEFDPQAALDRAMMVFWEKGFTETSYEDLVQATGVNRYGLYSTFGDKQEFFLKTIDHYANTTITVMLGPMERSDASTPAISQYFAMLLNRLGTPQEHLGCLIGNSAVEIAAPTEALVTRMNHHFERMRAAFRNALRGAQERGKISVDLDVEMYADYLVGVAMGYVVCVRGGMKAEQVKRFIEVALIQLN
ncbi:TetR family transcriptional regulator [Reticulibacter mediterranei]|uniref:TetR family transcriptional regulator n=1 Tax=Reticulibacter mediterranei TaxID=2778369 RepID=A0A8J3MZI0_9CHLR|nr:TetR/AcrR family transcriptional regulator [Reticulibacter mediterranei]GHO90235.1 TetR family transcriptional regulator [Reticulibacter mediterranei]